MNFLRRGSIPSFSRKPGPSIFPGNSIRDDLHPIRLDDCNLPHGRLEAGAHRGHRPTFAWRFLTTASMIQRFVVLPGEQAADPQMHAGADARPHMLPRRPADLRSRQPPHRARHSRRDSACWSPRHRQRHQGCSRELVQQDRPSRHLRPLLHGLLDGMNRELELTADGPHDRRPAVARTFGLRLRHPR